MKGNGLILLGLALAIIVLIGCPKTPDVRKEPAPTPEVKPDLEPTARKIRDDSAALAGELRLKQLEAELKTAADNLSKLATEHHLDVTEQRRQVDAALATYGKLRMEYVALIKSTARLRAENAKLKEDAKQKAWLEKVVMIGGMLSLVVILAVVWFGPVPAWAKPSLLLGLAGAGVMGVIGYVLRTYARTIIYGAIVSAFIALVAAVVYAWKSGKARAWLEKSLYGVTRAVRDENAVEVARRAADGDNTPDGLGDWLSERDLLLESREPSTGE